MENVTMKSILSDGCGEADVSGGRADKHIEVSRLHQPSVGRGVLERKGARRQREREGAPLAGRQPYLPY